MPTVEEMRVVMDAETARLHRKLSEADRRMAQFQRDTQNRLKAFDGYFRSVGGGIAALGAGVGTAQIVEYANAWTRVERSLRASEDIFGMRLHSSEELLALANDARVDLESYTKMYQRTAAAVRDYGMGANEAAKVTSALSMALKLGGTTAAEQSSVLVQFSQALNKGKLDGDEFRTVMEAAPVVVELLSSRLKISKGEIISWAREGKLGVKDLVGALVDGGGKIERIFRNAPATVEEAFIVLRNSVTGYVGRLDKATGASQTFISILAGVSNNIETIGNTALVASAALLTAFAPRVIAGVAGLGAAATVAMGPLGWIAALAGGGAAAMALYGDTISASADHMITLKDTASATATVLGRELSTLFSTLGAEAWAMVQDLTGAMDGVELNWQTVITGVRRFAINYIGVMISTARTIEVIWNNLGNAIREKVYDWTAAVVELVEKMVRGIASAVNYIPGVKIDIDKLIEFSSPPNPWAGAGTKMREDAAAAGESTGKAWADALEKKIIDEAEEIARARRWAEDALDDERNRDIEIKRNKPPVDPELIKKMKQADQELNDLYRKALEAAGRYTDAVVAEYVKDLEKYREMLTNKLITQEQFELARTRLAATAAKQMLEATEKEYKRLREVTDIFASGMEDAFSKFTESGKLDFKEMTRSILADMAKLIFRKSVIETLFGASGQGFGLLGSALGQAVPGLGSSGGIGSWTTTTSLPGFANGGRPTGPSWVGERGRELFIPDVPGTIVPNHKLGTGTGPIIVNFALDARGATRDTLPALERQVAELKRNLPRIITETVSEARDRAFIR